MKRKRVAHHAANLPHLLTLYVVELKDSRISFSAVYAGMLKKVLSNIQFIALTITLLVEIAALIMSYSILAIVLFTERPLTWLAVRVS